MVRTPWQRNSAPSSAIAAFRAAGSRWTRTVSTNRRTTQSMARLIPAAPITSRADTAIRLRYGRRKGKNRPNGLRRDFGGRRTCPSLFFLVEGDGFDHVLVEADKFHLFFGVVDPDVGEVQEGKFLVVQDVGHAVTHGR